MIASDPVPWYDRPPRPFPVHLWQARRYGFRIPPLRFAPPSAGLPERRPFPALLWSLARQQ